LALQPYSVDRPVDPYLNIDDYDPDADLMVLNLGPQHPSTHGVFRVKLVLDGEVVVKAVGYPGYLHRGVEKLLEKLTYHQQTPIVDKNDYLAPMINEMALNMAFEQLGGVEVPARAQHVRTLLAELQRIASHLVAIGTFGLDVGGALGGGASLFMYCFRDRELILDCFEALTGCRFHYNTHCIGGNRHDLPAGFEGQVLAALQTIEARLDDYRAMMTENPIFVDRTADVGVIPTALALGLGLSGPNARASGVDIDLRRDAPYAAYGGLDVRPAVRSAGDCQARFLCRVDEIRESIRLTRLLLAGVPEGPLCGAKPNKGPTGFKIKRGQAYTAVEGPRGELGHYLIAGGAERGACPYRLKIRPPSLHHVAAIPYILPGNNLSDCIAILGSLDPVMGEVDR
jgi:NADH-quinone oxidoreductase subunit D